MLLLYRGEEFDSNFYYHAGVDIDNCFLLVEGDWKKQGKKTLFTSNMNAEIARKTFKGKIEIYERGLEILKKRIKNKTISADLTSVSASMAARFGKICTLKDESEALGLLRVKKRPDEIAKVSKAAKIAHEVLESLDPEGARTELDLKSQILMKTLELNAEPAFEPIVSSGENTRFPHYSASNHKLGKMILVDMGVKYQYYRSDHTRMFFLEQDSKLQKEYETLQSICHSVTDSLPELKTGGAASAYADDLIKKANFPPMIHSLGHGIGLDVHEVPRISPKSDQILKGATIAIEPAFYNSKYGMRYEETVYFDGKKGKIL